MRIDVAADLNTEDETGLVWTFLEEAVDPSRIRPGDVVVAGSELRPVVCEVVDLVEKPAGTIVHLRILPDSVERYRDLPHRSDSRRSRPDATDASAYGPSVSDSPASRIVGDTVELDLSGAVGGPLSTWQDVERLGLALMRALGFDDARLTPAGADAGIDVDSRSAVCQVKHWTGQVGRREVQQLAGAATGRQAVFLAARYTSQAAAWASTSGVALFTFDGTTSVRTLNPPAVALAARQTLPQPSDRERALADRVARANRWLTALIAESNHVAAEPVFRRRDLKQNTKKVVAFQRRVPALRRGFEKIEATTTLKVAPLARLDRRLSDLERELRAAAKPRSTDRAWRRRDGTTRAR